MKKIFVSILFMAMLLPVASSQLPDVSNPGWSVGWEVEEDEITLELSNTFQFETKLIFWIDNARPLPSDYEIDVEITYPSKCDENSFSIDVESKVNVGANTNETFELKISGNGFGNTVGSAQTLCPTNEIFSLELSVNDLIVAGQAGDGSKTIEQNLRFSSVYALDIEFVETDNWNLVDEIKSGTSEYAQIIIRNEGNSPNSLSDAKASFRGCPQMDYSLSSVGDILGKVEPSGSAWEMVVEMSASSSHPDKKCDLIFSVVSEGDGRTYSETLEFNVEAIDIKEQNEELDEEETSDTSGLESDSSTLPAISSLMCIFTLLISSFFRREP